MAPDNPNGLAHRFFTVCMLILAGVAALTVAVHLLVLIWPWLLGGALLVAGIATLFWILRWSRRRW